jgi:hypothetical protein
MSIREPLLAAVMERFGDWNPRMGMPPDPLVVFPAKHPAVGDVLVTDVSLAPNMAVTVLVGSVMADTFHSYDVHLKPVERARRLTNEVVRLLQELFADRLLMWRSTDGRNRGWRERGDAGYTEPLVLDNRTYERYLWSGPLPEWQAVPAIATRGRIGDDREYQLVAAILDRVGPGALEPTQRELLERLAAEYLRSSEE